MSNGTAAARAATESAITQVWRFERTRLIAGLGRMARDLDLAEDLAQDALVAALEQWPTAGIPANPGAWLMTVAKRRGVDHFRRAQNLRERTGYLAHDLEEADIPDFAAGVDHIEDDVLRLIFLTCHPVLPAPSRAALCLRLLGGLTTGEIARGFLVPEPTMGQRISRAKRTLADAGSSFELPTGDDRRSRLADVLGIIYLIFNEGYSATAGSDWMRPDLCHEGIRLARLLAALMPREPEAQGLQALLELQASRLPARLDDEGRPVLLEEQDRARWDHLLIRRGLQALARAASAGGPIGTYTLQAEIAACHARAHRVEDTDWPRIAAWYDVLSGHAPGAVVEVNRAVAHGRAFGPDAGLRVLDAIDAPPRSHLLAAVRGDLLDRAGRTAEAAAAFREAAAATANASERAILLGRAEGVGAAVTAPQPARE